MSETDSARPSEAANAEFYDADSSSYDAQRWESAGGRATNEAQQAILADLCAGWRDLHVLEVGPGTARFTIPLLRAGNRATVLDISRGMLDTARGNIEGAGVGDRVEAYVQGSIYDLPFGDGTFDAAVSLNVFNHLERAGDALRELARVVRPGGRVLFNHANLRSIYYLAGRRINARSKAIGQDVYSRWETPADVRRMIEGAGLDEERRVGHVHVPRAAERVALAGALRALDRLSRRGPLGAVAPVQFHLCRRPEA
jgi:ubiquinone/menaquinone biosynthesis C-methylase UbiE